MLKVLYANSKNKLLAFYDGNGIASYNYYKRNMLNEDLDFSLANSICGYAIKNPANRIDYSSYNNWEKINCIDNVLGNYIKYDEFNNRKEKPISENTINILKIEIDELINKFLKN